MEIFLMIYWNCIVYTYVYYVGLFTDSNPPREAWAIVKARKCLSDCEWPEFPFGVKVSASTL